MCGGILHNWPLIETINLYAPTLNGYIQVSRYLTALHQYCLHGNDYEKECHHIYDKQCWLSLKYYQNVHVYSLQIKTYYNILIET